MKVTIKVAETAPFYANEREVERTVYLQEENGKRFYMPDHVGDVVSTSDGYAEVIEVTDHTCTAISGCGGTCGGDHLSDECCVQAITVEDK